MIADLPTGKLATPVAPYFYQRVSCDVFFILNCLYVTYKKKNNCIVKKFGEERLQNFAIDQISRITWSSRPEVFYKKDILRNFPRFTGKHLCQSLFFK